MRGLTDVEMGPHYIYQEDGPAPVGIMETTKIPTKYRWPGNEVPLVTLWDMPATGTFSGSDMSYFEREHLYAFDCLLLLRAGRFTQFDAAICQQASQNNIPLILVSSKGDQDIQSFKKIRMQNLRRRLSPEEYQELIVEVKRNVKGNASTELRSLRGFQLDNLQEIPMFIIAAQSYRDEMLGLLGTEDCPSLETKDLLEYCFRSVVEHRQKVDGNHRINVTSPDSNHERNFN